MNGTVEHSPETGVEAARAGMLAAFAVILRRDLLLTLRSPHDSLHPLGFLLMVIALFPLAVSPEPGVLRTLAPGVMWVAALLATMLSLEALFRSDFEDGSLEQLLVAPQPLFVLVLAKILAHWLVTGLPIAVLAPCLGFMLFLPAEGAWALFLTLLLGTPALSLVGAVGAALAVGLRRGGVMLSLLVIPLYVPVLIFGAAGVVAAVAGLDIVGHLALLGSLLALSVALCPVAAAAALRVSLGM